MMSARTIWKLLTRMYLLRKIPLLPWIVGKYLNYIYCGLVPKPENGRIGGLNSHQFSNVALGPGRTGNLYFFLKVRAVPILVMAISGTGLPFPEDLNLAKSHLFFPYRIEIVFIFCSYRTKISSFRFEPDSIKLSVLAAPDLLKDQ